MFEDTKGKIKIRKSKKDRQRNSETKNDKRINDGLQDITQKHEPHQVPAPHVALVVVLLLQTQLFGQLEPKELGMQGNLQILT
jgi:hypothetical protein